MLRNLSAGFGLLILCALPALAEDAPPTADEQFARAMSAAGEARVAGPARIALDAQAALELPEGFAFVRKEPAIALLEAMGNQTDAGFLGLVIGDQLQGFVSVRYDASGYVEDDEAREWDADELLQSLKDGTDAGNEERRSRGIPEFVVAGWVQAPAYDAVAHRLVWSAELREKGATGGGAESASVNYNTYQLGREGYVSMNLVTDLASIEAQKPLAHQLLAGLSFNDGKRYADFDPATDKVAAYGLAALVGGLAAKKLGLIAMAGLFLAKFGKVAALAAVGGAAVVGRLFRKRKSS